MLQLVLDSDLRLSRSCLRSEEATGSGEQVRRQKTQKAQSLSLTARVLRRYPWMLTDSFRILLSRLSGAPSHPPPGKKKKGKHARRAGAPRCRPTSSSCKRHKNDRSITQCEERGTAHPSPAPVPFNVQYRSPNPRNKIYSDLMAN